MQITIDTERDDLDQVARVVEVLRVKRTPQHVLDRAARIPHEPGAGATFDDAKPNAPCEVPNNCEDQGCPNHYAEPPEYPNAESLFSAGNDVAAAGRALAEELAKGPSVTLDLPGAELDKAGTPWDERIHASTKTKVADGTWKKKRGVDQETYDAVMSELAVGPDPEGYQERATDPKPPADGVEGLASDRPQPAPAQNVVASASPVPPPPAPTTPPAPPVTGLDFAGLIKMVMESDGKVGHAELHAACKAEGVESFPSLQKQQDKVPAVAKRLGLA